MPISQREFRTHFNSWYSQIYRYAASRLPFKEAAEDVVSDTFLHAWSRQESYDSTQGEVAGWLTGIARHKIADYWRSRQFELWDDADLERIMEHPHKTLLDTLDDHLAFDAIMSSLPQEMRALLTLRHVDDLPCEDIAEIIGKSPEATRQSLSRIHRKLRNLFPQYEFTD